MRRDQPLGHTLYAGVHLLIRQSIGGVQPQRSQSARKISKAAQLGLRRYHCKFRHIRQAAPISAWSKTLDGDSVFLTPPQLQNPLCVM